MKTRGNGRRDEILSAITESGGRVTEARREIIVSLERCTQPVTIQEITRTVSADEVSVYRTISVLRELGFIEEIDSGDGIRRYSLRHGHHDHIVCRNCGFVAHIPCRENGKRMPSHKDFSTVSEHSVTYYGTCTECRE